MDGIATAVTVTVTVAAKKASRDETGRKRSSHSAAAELAWMQKFGQLQAFYQTYGHCDPSSLRQPEQQRHHHHRHHHQQSLANWVMNQRNRYKIDNTNASALDPLTSEQLDLLKSIDFFSYWIHDDTKLSATTGWYNMFLQLSRYKHVNGDCRVRLTDNPELGSFVRDQRHLLNNNITTAGDILRDREKLLDSIGFDWSWAEPSVVAASCSLHSERREDRDEPIKRVSRGHDKAPTLKSQVPKQYIAHRSGTLSEERTARLIEIGVVSSQQVHKDPSQQWADMFQRLHRYTIDHGNCRVPWKYHKDSTLAKWVIKQRNLRKGGKLSEERATKLEEIGFAWSTQQKQWQLMFEQLKQYKMDHGDCRVPRSFETTLSGWVGTQRHNHRHGKLNKDRTTKLEEIGFTSHPLLSIYKFSDTHPGGAAAVDGASDPPTKNEAIRNKKRKRGEADVVRSLSNHRDPASTAKQEHTSSSGYSLAACTALPIYWSDVEGMGSEIFSDSETDDTVENEK